MEQGAVCGGTGILIALICVATFFLTARYAKQAKAVARHQKEENFKRRISQMQGDNDSEAPNDEQGENPEDMDNLRSGGDCSAENDGMADVPSFGDVFTPRDKAGNTRQKRVADVKFVSLTPSTPQSSKMGTHKVSTLPSWHAKNNANVSVIFVAYHSSGKNETGFYTRSSKPLRSVMDAWCAQHCLPKEKAIFTYLGCIVDPQATVRSLGHDPAKGPLVIRARPNHEVEDTNKDFDPIKCSIDSDYPII